MRATDRQPTTVLIHRYIALLYVQSDRTLHTTNSTGEFDLFMPKSFPN